MTTFYGPQIAQMNKKPFWGSSLNFTLTQHSHDEDPKLQNVQPHLEIEPP
jgi:hypothetical protein